MVVICEQRYLVSHVLCAENTFFSRAGLFSWRSFRIYYDCGCFWRNGGRMSRKKRKVMQCMWTTNFSWICAWSITLISYHLPMDIDFFEFFRILDLWWKEKSLAFKILMMFCMKVSNTIQCWNSIKLLIIWASPIGNHVIHLSLRNKDPSRIVVCFPNFLYHFPLSVSWWCLEALWMWDKAGY